MAEGVWFNMWTRRLWPFAELEVEDILYFYESPNRRIVWKTRVTKTDRFQYQTKENALVKLRREFGPFDPHQPYVEQAPDHGFCLAYAVTPLEKLNSPLPPGMSMPQQGWLRLTSQSVEWISSHEVQDPETQELLRTLRRLSERMAAFPPEKVESEVVQFIRGDHRIVRLFKELANYACQFPNCGETIECSDGGLYIEVAHIKPVKKGGLSTLGNLVVLCPNHHKEFDCGKLEIVEQTDTSVKGRLNKKTFEIHLPGA